MGDPRKRRKKYSAPFQKWEKSRIDEERELINVFGLKNKKEVWKARSQLRNFARQAKRLVALNSVQAEKEKEQLLSKLKHLSILPSSAQLENILDLDISDVLNRRLQTVVFKKGLARSVSSARQFITHGHIMVNNVKVTIPSYMVASKDEPLIVFSNNSPFIDSMHPEMAVSKKKSVEVKDEG